MSALRTALRSYRLRAGDPASGRRAARSALFVICSEDASATAFATAVDPALILQNFGATLPPPGGAPCGASTTITYALLQERVGHIVLCGHAACRFHAPDAELGPQIEDRRFTPAQRASQSSLLLQADRAWAHARALERPARLHALWFDEEEGDVYAYRPDERRFELFDDLDVERLLVDLDAPGAPR
jgi:carbonic anhydrase